MQVAVKTVERSVQFAQDPYVNYYEYLNIVQITEWHKNPRLQRVERTICPALIANSSALGP